MKKLGLLLMAGLMVFALAGCKDVTQVSIVDEDLGSEGPSLKDLIGTWTGTEVATQLTKTVTTVSTTAAGEPLADTTSQSKITTSNWSYSLDIEEGATKDDPATFTLTFTESMSDPGLLVSNVNTATANTTTTTSYGTVTDVNNAAGDNSFAPNADTAMSPFDQDFAGSTNANAAAFGADGNGDFGVSQAQAAGLTTPTAVAIGGTASSFTWSGTVTEGEYFNSALGRTLKSYVLAAGPGSSTAAAAGVVENSTATAPTVIFDTTAGALQGATLYLLAEDDFVYNPDDKTWILTGISANDWSFGNATGGGLTMVEEDE